MEPEGRCEADFEVASPPHIEIGRRNAAFGEGFPHEDVDLPLVVSAFDRAPGNAATMVSRRRLEHGQGRPGSLARPVGQGNELAAVEHSVAKADDLRRTPEVLAQHRLRQSLAVELLDRFQDRELSDVVRRVRRGGKGLGPLLVEHGRELFEVADHNHVAGAAERQRGAENVGQRRFVDDQPVEQGSLREVTANRMAGG